MFEHRNAHPLLALPVIMPFTHNFIVYPSSLISTSHSVILRHCNPSRNLLRRRKKKGGGEGRGTLSCQNKQQNIKDGIIARPFPNTATANCTSLSQIAAPSSAAPPVVCGIKPMFPYYPFVVCRPCVYRLLDKQFNPLRP